MKHSKTSGPPTEYEELTGEQKSQLELADHVKQLRAHFGQSQQAFASTLGLSIRAVANYESQARRPEDRILALFAKTAADAGRDDLAFEFLHEMGLGLRLDEIRDGGIITWDSAKKRGYLLVQLADEEAHHHAQAYYRASRGKFRDMETKAKGQELLNRFATEVSKLPGPARKDVLKHFLARVKEGKK
jgi:DNA-binding transcriptional regulator YiaG